MSEKSTSNESKRKKSSLGKKILIAFIAIEVAGLVTSLGVFIAAIVAGIDGFKLASIGGGIFGSVVGAGMLTIIVGGAINGFKQRKAMQIEPSGLRAADSPYPVKNYPDYIASSKKKVYYCSYCGYGTDTFVGECPECGGPLKER